MRASSQRRKIHESEGEEGGASDFSANEDTALTQRQRSSGGRGKKNREHELEYEQKGK